MTETDYMSQEKKEQEDLPTLKFGENPEKSLGGSGDLILEKAPTY